MTSYIVQTNTQPLLFFHTHNRYGYDINCIQGFKGCTAVQRCSLTAAHTKDKWFFTLPQQHVFCLSEYKKVHECFSAHFFMQPQLQGHPLSMLPPSCLHVNQKAVKQKQVSIILVLCYSLHGELVCNFSAVAVQTNIW